MGYRRRRRPGKTLKAADWFFSKKKGEKQFFIRKGAGKGGGEECIINEGGEYTLFIAPG